MTMCIWILYRINIHLIFSIIYLFMSLCYLRVMYICNNVHLLTHLLQVELLKSRSAALEELCKARFEAGERSVALNQFLDKYNSVKIIIIHLFFFGGGAGFVSIMTICSYNLLFYIFRTTSTVSIVQLSTWMTQIGHAALGSHHNMGSDLYTAREFLELHERLEEDIKV